MPTLKYKDPADGLWKSLFGVSDDVEVGPETPTADTVELWVDTDEDITPAIAYEVPGRNKIINGDMSVNQRAFTSATTSVYGLDRWYAAFSGGSSTYSVQTAAFGDLPESARRYARIVTSGVGVGAGDYAILNQTIEGVATLSGKMVTVSFWARAATGTPRVAVNLEQNHGTGGSPTSGPTRVLGSVTLSTSWKRYSLSYLLTPLPGSTVLGTNNNDGLILRFYVSSGSTFNSNAHLIGRQDNTFDFWGVQIEEGAVATAFERESYGDNLRRCQRYFYRISASGQAYGTFGWGMGESATRIQFMVPLPVEMRIPPVATWVTGSLGAYDQSATIPGSAALIASARNTKYIGHAALPIAAGGVAGKMYEIIAHNSPLTAIDFNAEL
jgi:hypothetical protein